MEKQKEKIRKLRPIGKQKPNELEEYSKLEIKKQKSGLDEYSRLEKFFEKIDKIWEKDFGTACPEFVPNCPQCKFSLIYHNFKQKVFEECFGK